MSFVRTWGRSASYMVRAVCFLQVTHDYLYEFTETRGESMFPTLAAENDFVHVSKKYRDGNGVRMGDCVVAAKPTDHGHRVCKRITGMPGDLILSDPMDPESYIEVPKGHVWVTGDNLEHSLDSRTYNSLPMGLIKGKIVAANDFNAPAWDPITGIFGFRWITNSFKEFSNEF